MRIAIFADSLPPSADGVARTYTRFSEYLEQQNYHYLIFSPFKPGTDFIGYPNVIHLPSVPLIFYPHYKIALSTFRFVSRHLDSLQPDVIHVSSPTPIGLVALKYARKKNIPVVAGYHTDFIGYFKYYGFAFARNFGWSYLRWFYNKFDKVLVPSQSTKQLLQKKSFLNVALWTRGIDADVFYPGQKKDDKTVRLIFAGRLVKEKDLLELVNVCALLDKHNLNYEIIFAGDGELRQTLAKKIKKSHVTGFIEQVKLAELYRSSDIFVFPSTTETFGNVVLEALASGLPVIVSDGGAAKDLVLHGQTGFVAKAHDVRKFAEYTVLLILNKQLRLRLSRNARQFSLDYQWENVHASLIDTYLQLINTNRSQSIFPKLRPAKVA